MNIDQYLNEVNSAAKYFSDNGIMAHDYIEELASDPNRDFSEIIEFRKDVLSQHDHEYTAGYLEFGLYSQFNTIDRKAIFSFLFEVDRSLLVMQLQKRFEHYKKSQEIFNKDETLWDCLRIKNNKYDLELFDSSKFKYVNGTEIFHRNGHYYKLEPFLNPSKELFLPLALLRNCSYRY